MAVAYGWKRRLCDYGNGSVVLATASSSERRFEIFSPSADELHEMAYVVLLSAMGEELDRKSLHRVHALGFETPGGAGLLIAPQGGGKSSLAALLERTPEVRIYSDESPLIDGKSVYPFPVRMALKPELAEFFGLEGGRLFRRKKFPEKLLFPLPETKIARPAPLRWILVGRVGATQPVIRPSSAVRGLSALTEAMVVGMGNAQMAEFMLRSGMFSNLSRIGLSRLKAAVLASLHARVFLFDLAADPRANHAIFSRFLKSL
jgi:hypothetical protein